MLLLMAERKEESLELPTWPPRMSAHLYLSACPSWFLLSPRIEVPGLHQPPASEPPSSLLCLREAATGYQASW